MATPVAQAPLPSLMREAGRGGSMQAMEGYEDGRGRRRREAGEGERQDKGKGSRRGEAGGGERQ